MKRLILILLLIATPVWGAQKLADQYKSNTFTQEPTFSVGIAIGPTNEDGEIELPKANQGTGEAGNFRIAYDGYNLAIQAYVDGAWANVAYDATTKSFKYPFPYPVTITESFTISDETSSVLGGQSYEVATTDSFTVADATVSATETWSSDLFTGGTATAESQYLAFGPDRAFDDNSSTTSWISANDVTEWIKYDFGSGVSHVVDRIKVYKDDTTSGSCTTLNIEGSNNDSSWTQLGDASYSPTEAAWTTIDFTNSTAYRYIRVTVLTNTNSRCEIMELEAYKYE